MKDSVSFDGVVSEEQVKREIQLEEESVELGVKRYQDALLEAKQANDVTRFPPELRLINECMSQVVPAIENLKDARKNKKHRRTAKHGIAINLLRKIDTHEVAYIVSRYCIAQLHSGIPLQMQSQHLAKEIIWHLEFKELKKNEPGLVKMLTKRLNNSNLKHKRNVFTHNRHNRGYADVDWSDVQKHHLGAMLLDVFAEHSGIMNMELLFPKKKRQGGAYKQPMKVLRAKPEVLRWLEKAHATAQVMQPIYQPMVVPPVDWNSTYGGGYLTNFKLGKMKLIKTRNNKVFKEAEKHDLSEVLEALNFIQKVPYRINKDVLNLLNEVYQKGGGFAGVPEFDKEMKITFPEPGDDASEEELKRYKYHCRLAHDEWADERSKRESFVRKKWLGNKFVNDEAIYFPWTLDYRGRFYPSGPAFIHPQGDDSGKALIEFARGKRIGKDGLFWLAVHGANCYGEADKESFEDRVKWVHANEDAILAVASEPFGNYFKWWAGDRHDIDGGGADEPFMFYAFCCEWAKAKEQGEDFITHLPVGMDGSCSGIQHFSALQLDKRGAKAVNLLPGDKPSDIYKEVAAVLAKKVEQAVDIDLNYDLEPWIGRIDRKIAKRATMTRPYGVTKYGITDQLVEELKKYRKRKGVDYFEGVENPFKYCQALAQPLHDSIDEVVKSSRHVMDWLRVVAELCSAENKPIKWVTPTGFPVYQGIVKTRTKRVKTFFGGTLYRLGIKEDTKQLDGRGQKNGIAPNFVHSMDAAHCCKTILAMKHKGYTDFAPVHDSFGVHACDVSALHSSIREEFVKIYKENWLKKFQKQVEEYTGLELPDPPKQGDLDIEQVLESRYFFA
jgi:DNA-directed RNA polymerase